MVLLPQRRPALYTDAVLHVSNSDIPTIASQDPWCQGLATATRGLTVAALIAAITSFIFSMMAAMDIKTPTWDGEGKETTLVHSVVCSLCQVLFMVPAVVSWQRMVWQYDSQCRAAMNIDDFACISSASSHLLAIIDIPFAMATYLLWRLSHSYHVRKLDHLGGSEYRHFVCMVLSGSR